MNIVEYQQAVRACPHVWGVYVHCDGETDLVGLYDSKDAAQAHKDWQNGQRRYYGRASISRMPVLTRELAVDRYGTKGDSDD